MKTAKMSSLLQCRKYRCENNLFLQNLAVTQSCNCPNCINYNIALLMIDILCTSEVLSVYPSYRVQKKTILRPISILRAPFS